MGRRIPIGGDNNGFDLIHFSVLSLSLLHMAWMAATVATITALCIRRKSKQPKPSSPSSSSSSHNNNNNLQVFTPEISNGVDKSSPAAAAITSTVEETEIMEKTPFPAVVSDHQQHVKMEMPMPPPPPPPAAAMMKKKKKTLRETCSSNNMTTRTLSMQRIGKNLSMKISRSMSMRLQQQQQHEQLGNNKRKGKLKADQDSIWSKAIILGEKCRPDDEDDTVIYDNKGNRISPYHKKTYSHHLSSLSRTISQFDTQAISSSGLLLDNQDKGTVRKDDGVNLSMI